VTQNVEAQALHSLRSGRVGEHSPVNAAVGHRCASSWGAFAAKITTCTCSTLSCPHCPLLCAFLGVEELQEIRQLQPSAPSLPARSEMIREMSPALGVLVLALTHSRPLPIFGCLRSAGEWPGHDSLEGEGRHADAVDAATRAGRCAVRMPLLTGAAA
jgi:hypothetical protein